MTDIQREHFDNFVDFLEIGKKAKSERRLAANRCHKGSADEDDAGAREWCGAPEGWSVKTSALAERLALGYEEGAERVTKMRETIAIPSMVNVRRRPIWKDQGDHLDMDRVRSGRLDTAWRGVSRVACQPPRVLIMADTGANCSTDADCMAWRGVAALSLADALNAAGYQVAIIQANRIGLYGADYKLVVTTVVKPFRAPLSILDLASSIVLPATFRSLGINAFWYLASRDLGTGCGTSQQVLEDDAPDMGQNMTIVLSQEVDDADSARKWVEEQIKIIEGKYRLAA
jgi:hypothetical protein